MSPEQKMHMLNAVIGWAGIGLAIIVTLWVTNR